jgi:murein DD-endopeptidase MepM/ murein hydrolase activator NlpD
MSSLSSPLQAVVALFSGPLHGVRFAEIDGDGLGTLATEVEALSSDVATQEAELANLRETLALKQEALNTLAQQALAYARIYAESDEALSAELDEIALPRAGKPRKAGSVKSPSERSSKAPKDALESAADANGSDTSGIDVEMPEPEPARPAKATRKAAAAPVEDEPEEVAAPAKAGRRKVPTRTGRASR